MGFYVYTVQGQDITAHYITGQTTRKYIVDEYYSSHGWAQKWQPPHRRQEGTLYFGKVLPTLEAAQAKARQNIEETLAYQRSKMEANLRGSEELIRQQVSRHKERWLHETHLSENELK